MAPYVETRWTVWARSLGMLLVGIAGLVVSGTGLSVQRTFAEYQMRTSAADLALKQSAFQHQRQVEEARLAASVIALLRCNDDLQSASALRLLSTGAPRFGEQFGALLLSKCTSLSAPSKLEVATLQHESGTQRTKNEFFQRLQNAHEYRGHGHDGPAARLFDQASRVIPPDLRERIDGAAVRRAQEAFRAGHFAEAADIFAQAFQALSGDS